jgi:hypothetical protein
VTSSASATAALPRYEGLLHDLGGDDKAVAERAARRLRQISQSDLSALYPWRKQLLKQAFAAQDLRVQWNLTIILGRLPLRGRDKAVAVDLFFERLRDKSPLNRTFAMQALIDLSEDDPGLRARVLPILQEALEHGTAAMRARARLLLAQCR